MKLFNPNLNKLKKVKLVRLSQVLICSASLIFLSVCNKKNCNKKSAQQSTRDILLISVFVLEHLISRHRYSEAETILDSLGSCKNICGDSITKTCCCNG